MRKSDTPAELLLEALAPVLLLHGFRPVKRSLPGGQWRRRHLLRLQPWRTDVVEILWRKIGGLIAQFAVEFPEPFRSDGPYHFAGTNVTFLITGQGGPFPLGPSPTAADFDRIASSVATKLDWFLPFATPGGCLSILDAERATCSSSSPSSVLCRKWLSSVDGPQERVDLPPLPVHVPNVFQEAFEELVKRGGGKLIPLVEEKLRKLRS